MKHKRTKDELDGKCGDVSSQCCLSVAETAQGWRAFQLVIFLVGQQGLVTETPLAQGQHPFSDQS